MAANRGVMFSFMDQLHFLLLSQMLVTMLVTMPDPTSRQPSAPAVPFCQHSPPLPTPAAAQQLPSSFSPSQ